MPGLRASDLGPMLVGITRPVSGINEAPGVGFESEPSADGDDVVLIAFSNDEAASVRLKLPMAHVRRRLSDGGRRTLVALREWRWALLFELHDRVRLELGIRGEV